MTLKLNDYPTRNKKLNDAIESLTERFHLRDIDFNQEYELIQKKISKLSASKRKMVCEIVEASKDPSLFDNDVSDVKEKTNELSEEKTTKEMGE